MYFGSLGNPVHFILSESYAWQLLGTLLIPSPFASVIMGNKFKGQIMVDCAAPKLHVNVLCASVSKGENAVEIIANSAAIENIFFIVQKATEDRNYSAGRIIRAKQLVLTE